MLEQFFHHQNFKIIAFQYARLLKSLIFSIKIRLRHILNDLVFIFRDYEERLIDEGEASQEVGLSPADNHLISTATKYTTQATIHIQCKSSKLFEN